MTLNFDDKKKYDTIAKIRDAKDEKGNAVFTEEERGYFFDLLVSDTEKARGVAKLLLKVKDYKKWVSPDAKSIDYLELEKLNNSLAYRVVNSKGYLVDMAIAHLKTLNRVGKDIPKEELARKAKIEEYKLEIARLQGEQGPREKRRVELQIQRQRVESERDELKSLSSRRESLIKVLNVEAEPDAVIVASDGTEKKLSSLTVNYKDYSNESDLWMKEDKDISTKNESVLIAVKVAKNYLEEIVKGEGFSYRMTNQQVSVESDIAGHFSDRKWNNKNNVTSGFKDFGNGYLKVLRSIGVDKLKEIIDNDVTYSNKDELKKIAEEIVKYIDRQEPMTNDVGNSEDYEDEEWANARDNWHETLLTKKNNEYPYVMVPDYKKIFLFMKVVFGANVISGTPVKVINLKVANYLDNPDHDRYIKPAGGKKGWSGLFINGLAESPRVLLQSTGSSEKSIVSYLNKNPNDTKISAIVKRQLSEGPIKVGDEWDFKSLTKLWWDVYSSYMRDPISLTDNEFVNDNVSYDEEQTYNYRNELRYCKTMKSILSDLKLLSQPDQFDRYLLEISNKASLGSESDSNEHLQQQTFFQKVKEGLIWPGEHDYKKFGVALTSLVSNSKQRISAAESEVSRVNNQISQLDEKIAEDQNKIDEYRSLIEILEDIGNFKEKTIEEKKRLFEDLYNKKGSQSNKWKYSELLKLQEYLRLIKEEMDDSNFVSEKFKEKNDEIEGIITEVKKLTDDIYTYWINIKEEGDVSKTITQTIIEIKKNGAERGVTLEKARDALKLLGEKVILLKNEQDSLEKLNDAIAHPDKYKEEAPISTLTLPELRDIFAVSDNTKVLDDELKLSEWQATKNFEEKAKIEELVKEYRPNPIESVKIGEFKQYLEHATKWEGGKTGKISGVDYWETFVKKGPRFIIGAIKCFDYEKSYGEFTDAAKKTEVDTALAAANGYKNSDGTKVADENDTWKNGDARHMAKFLYKRAIGETGEQLVKKLKDVQSPTPSDNNNENADEKKWEGNWLTGGFSGNYRPWVTYLGGVALVIGVLVLIFWKNIKEWWDGPAEEQGKVGDTDEKEENEE